MHFTAVFRTHEGLNPDLNYQVYDDSATALHFAHYAKIYKALEFYRQQLIVEASNTGIPVNRPLFLEFPTDTNTHNISYQEFMLGSEFIIAPILDPNTTSKSLYLPQGSWTNLWNGNTIESMGAYYVENGLEDKPAVYYKTGSATALEFKNNLNNLGISVP
jgi:alpha-glucosidase (family GH31 glycosyl hydrolase)